MKWISSLLRIISILVGIQGLVFATGLEGIDGREKILSYDFSMDLGPVGSTSDDNNFAAAYISGAASLLLSLCPDLGHTQIIRMINLATDDSSLFDRQEFIANLEELTSNDCN